MHSEQKASFVVFAVCSMRQTDQSQLRLTSAEVESTEKLTRQENLLMCSQIKYLPAEINVPHREERERAAQLT